MKTLLFAISLLTAPVTSLFATQDFTVGASSCLMRRMRPGGTQQRGNLSGPTLSYDRIQRCKWYWGGDLLYAWARLSGVSSSGSPIVSDLSDRIWELRCGYTLQLDHPSKLYIIPFGGYGGFREVNDFTPPTVIPFTFTETFNFPVTGFLSGVNITSLVSIGVNFKVRYMLRGKSIVSNDPFFEDAILHMNDEIFCNLDFPILITSATKPDGLKCSFTPFFEYRHFGGREGFPFDYVDTKFYLLGARASLIYRY